MYPLHKDKTLIICLGGDGNAVAALFREHHPELFGGLVFLIVE